MTKKFDEILTETLKKYGDMLYGPLYAPSTLLNFISPEATAERARLDAIGPRHHPDIYEMWDVQLEEFMVEFEALLERHPDVEFVSEADINIAVGSAYRDFPR